MPSQYLGTSQGRAHRARREMRRVREQGGHIRRAPGESVMGFTADECLLGVQPIFYIFIARF